MAMTIFQLVKMLVNKQITNKYGNAKFNKDNQPWNELTVYRNPKYAVEWLKNNCIADIDVQVKHTYYGVEYVIHLKDYNLEHQFFEKEKRRTIPASGLQDYYDKHRPDDNRYYSQSRIDDEYYVQDESRYERLSLEDNCTFELFIQKLGYNNYHDFLLAHENDTKEFREILDEEYEEFLKEISAKEYEI